MAPSKDIVATGETTAVIKIDPDQTLKASKALLAHIQKAALSKDSQSTKKNLLSEEDDGETPIWLTLTTKRHIADKARLQPGKITLPHPINSASTATICLITADPQRTYKDIIASDEFPAELGKRITRVIGLTKLKAKYGQYEAQRKLFAEHDVFLADERIVNRVPKVLGKTFYKSTAKRPIPVILAARPTKGAEGKKTKAESAATPAQIAKEVEKAIGSALVNLSPTTNTAIRIGVSSMTAEEIAANTTAVVEALVGKWVPQKWRNVRSIHVKGPETAALPIWLTDELWVDGGDVISNEAAEKANVGKKRKAVEEDAQTSKKSKVEKELPEADDAVLDGKIKERKAKLRKAKGKAQKAMEE